MGGVEERGEMREGIWGGWGGGRRKDERGDMGWVWWRKEEDERGIWGGWGGGRRKMREGIWGGCGGGRREDERGEQKNIKWNKQMVNRLKPISAIYGINSTALRIFL